LVWPAVAAFFLIFSLPAFLYLPHDRAGGMSVPQAAVWGVTSFREIVSEVWRLKDLRNFLIAFFFYIDGVLTHLAEAEAAEDEFTQAQLRDFAAAVGEIRRRGHRPAYIHASNSAALMMGRSSAPEVGVNLVRPGIALYGHAPDSALEGAWPLRPVMSFETAISFLKKVPAGAQLSYGRTWTATPSHPPGVQAAGLRHSC
ncbi:MAG: MFS transporter, partial [Planctomycetaceae bacterium]